MFDRKAFDYVEEEVIADAKEFVDAAKELADHVAYGDIFTDAPECKGTVEHTQALAKRVLTLHKRNVEEG